MKNRGGILSIPIVLAINLFDVPFPGNRTAEVAVLPSKIDVNVLSAIIDIGCESSFLDQVLNLAKHGITRVLVLLKDPDRRDLGILGTNADYGPVTCTNLVSPFGFAERLSFRLLAYSIVE